MIIEVTDRALNWFQKELDIKAGDSVQFFVRFGGCGNFQSGFSLGVQVKTPDDISVSINKEGVQFYIENKDVWYFDGENLKVDYNDSKGEVEFIKT